MRRYRDLRSELELGLDDATPNIGGAVASFAAVVANTAGIQLLAGDPEHTRCDADVVGDLELIPSFQSDGHALIFTPASVVR